ncbi:MAG: hypothetical protein ACRYFS_15535 [Janthinobacterium lividum]
MLPALLGCVHKADSEGRSVAIQSIDFFRLIGRSERGCQGIDSCVGDKNAIGVGNLGVSSPVREVVGRWAVPPYLDW